MIVLGVVIAFSIVEAAPAQAADTTSYLNANWCIRDDNTARSIGGAGSACSSSASPMTQSLAPLENRFVYANEYATNANTVQLMQQLRLDCPGYGLANTRNNITTLATPLRILVRAASSVGVVCDPKAKSDVVIGTPTVHYLTLPGYSTLRPSSQNTYLKIYGDNQIGAETWLDGASGPYRFGPSESSGTSGFVLSHTFIADPGATSVNPMEDVQVVNCFSTVATDCTGIVGAMASLGDEVQTRLRVDQLTPGGSPCATTFYPSSSSFLDTIIPQKEHYRQIFGPTGTYPNIPVLTTSGSGVNSLICTPQFAMKTEVRWISGNPIAVNVVESHGIALNVFPTSSLPNLSADTPVLDPTQSIVDVSSDP